MPRRAVFLSLLLGTMLAFAAVAAPPQPSPVKPTPSASQTPSVVINNIPPSPPSSSNALPKWNKFGWTYWLPLLLQALAVGGFALWQFNRTHRLALARHEQERLHFERRELQEQFVDIENRLASTEPIIRANAALRLAEFAKRPPPRPAESPDAPPRTQEHHPYFVPVASQLATALHLEPNAAVRQDIRQAFRSLTEWAKEETDQPLLHALIERLADANRTAKNAFIKALAEYAAVRCATPENSPEPDFQFLTALAPFCDKAETTEICLRALMTEGEGQGEAGQVVTQGKYGVQQAVYEAKRKAQTEEKRTKEDATRLPKLEMAAQQLVDTRDALAQALRALAQPADFPQQAIDEALRELSAAVSRLRADADSPQAGKSALKQINSSAEAIQKTLRQWKAIRPPSLSNCFLAGADLREAQLQGAVLDGAQLQDADLRWAQLQGTNFIMAQLQGADLREAQLKGANLDGAQLQGADLSGAQLKGTILFDIFVQETASETYRRTNFAAANWQEAVWTETVWADAENRSRTERVRAWLAREFPQKKPDNKTPPAEEKTVSPSTDGAETEEVTDSGS